jgi:hypothetical protein
MRTLAFASLALMAGAGLAHAQSGAPQRAKPMFITLPNHDLSWKPSGRASSPLPQWTGSFTDNLGQTVNYTMVGTDPATSNTTTFIRVYIVPIKTVFGTNNGNMTFDPLAVTLPGGQSLIDNIVASPLFSKGVVFNQGGVMVGKGQYIDAYQRANFWSSVSTNTGYHVQFMTPVVLPEKTITVPVRSGNVVTNPFGANPVGQIYVNYFDKQLVKLMGNMTHVRPGVLPLFVSYDTFLTEVPLEGCCIGGYHSAIGSQPDGQTYAYTTYEDEAGSFSENVSAMSHELGEWMDDPFVDNGVNCLDNQLMEVGDPLENNANYGTFPYTLNGSTYNLQSLVFIGYFGAPRSTSVNSWLSFQNDEASVCPGQGTPGRGQVFQLH